MKICFIFLPLDLHNMTLDDSQTFVKEQVNRLDPNVHFNDRPQTYVRLLSITYGCLRTTDPMNLMERAPDKIKTSLHLDDFIVSKRELK